MQSNLPYCTLYHCSSEGPARLRANYELGLQIVPVHQQASKVLTQCSIEFGLSDNTQLSTAIRSQQFYTWFLLSLLASISVTIKHITSFTQA